MSQPPTACKEGGQQWTAGAEVNFRVGRHAVLQVYVRQSVATSTTTCGSLFCGRAAQDIALHAPHPAASANPHMGTHLDEQAVPVAHGGTSAAPPLRRPATPPGERLRPLLPQVAGPEVSHHSAPVVQHRRQLVPGGNAALLGALVQAL
jgi:hypothetical protein